MQKLSSFFDESRSIADVDESEEVYKNLNIVTELRTVDPTYRRKGLAQLALKEIIKKSINELSLSQLYAEIFSSNKSTIQLFEKAGFKMNGVKKNWIRKQETYEDVLFYQLIKS